MDAARSRKIDRKHVLMRATIIAPDGIQEATVRDLSACGVHVACASPLTPESDVVFKRGTIFAAARVAWVKENGAGLEFYRHLKTTDLTRARRSN